MVESIMQTLNFKQSTGNSFCFLSATMRAALLSQALLTTQRPLKA